MSKVQRINDGNLLACAKVDIRSGNGQEIDSEPASNCH